MQPVSEHFSIMKYGNKTFQQTIHEPQGKVQSRFSCPGVVEGYPGGHYGIAAHIMQSGRGGGKRVITSVRTQMRTPSCLVDVASAIHYNLHSFVVDSSVSSNGVLM